MIKQPSYKYKQNCGSETLEREYKIMSFYTGGLPITMDIAEELVLNSKWIFNEYIIKNIKTYIRTYLPKYICGFMNTLSDNKSGKFIIGIDDNGIIEGIPFQGDFNILEIKSYMNKIIDEMIVPITNTSKEFIKEHIKINLIPVYYKNRLLTAHCPLLDKFYKKYKESELKYQEKTIAYKNWYDKSHIYFKKLVILFNNPITRKELRNYIYERDPNNPVLDIIDSDIELTQLPFNSVKNFKQDINSPYYWLCKWKDEIIAYNKSIKPIHFQKPTINAFINPHTIISRITPMIPWWMQLNDNMKLYILEFDIIKPNIYTDLNYIDALGRVMSSYRHIIENEPCCIPSSINT
jgi:hypothetical protein